MKKLLSAILVLFGLASAARSQAPAPLTSLRAIHAITNAQASHALPVAFEATVTYFRGYERTLFVQDGGCGIVVKTVPNTSVVPGDRVLIQGTTQASFRPLIVGGRVSLLRHGALPRPMPANFGELIRGQRDSMLVTVHAQIRSANLVLPPQAPVHSTYLEMLTDEGYVDATVNAENAAALKDLLDAEVEITGAVGGKFDDKMEQTGILLHVSSLAGIQVLKRSISNPWSLAITPMDEILSNYQVKDLTRRVRVHGTITYYQPGSAVVLQEGTRSLWISTQTSDPLQIGDAADATGFPDILNGFLTVTGGEIRDSGIPAPIAPQPVTWRQLAQSDDTANGHHYDLASIEGQVVSEVREASQDEYVLDSDGHLFTAIYRHPRMPEGVPLPPMKQIPVGSRGRVTGICMPNSSDPLNGPVPFDMLMRSFDDIVVVARPSILNVRNLILLVGLLLAVVVTVSARGWTLEHKMRRQTAAMAARIEAEAHLEQRRSRILEDINESRPLAEILEQITEIVSFRLNGAPCWCEIAGGAHLGNKPAAIEGLRIAVREIPARTGAPLGAIFVVLGPEQGTGGEESEALWMGARLAALAIETRRLYTDLVHRSEFDLLTDIHNRFSLDCHLDARIASARETASSFGLIYVDLDEFKQVNDLYGHHIGDLYLQEVSLRMKRQLRAGDMLARLGGDEFAALVSTVRSRADVEEIALRMERCFDDPYAVGGSILHGSASVGFAIYPEDGATKDSLLSTADAAMYVVKHMKRQTVARGPLQA